MQKSNTNLILIVATLLLLSASVAFWYIKNQGAQVASLIGEPIPESVRAYMDDREFKGEFFIVLLDVEQPTSVKQFPNLFNVVVRKNKKGHAGRILYAYPTNSSIAQEKYAENMDGGTTSIIASKAVLFSDKEIEHIQKPCVLLTENGTINSILLDQSVDTWLQE